MASEIHDARDSILGVSSLYLQIYMTLVARSFVYHLEDNDGLAGSDSIQESSNSVYVKMDSLLGGRGAGQESS
jgi:hypothetical protein